MLVPVAAKRLLPAVLRCAAVLPVSQETGAWGGKEPHYPKPAYALLRCAGLQLGRLFSWGWPAKLL